MRSRLSGTAGPGPDPHAAARVSAEAGSVVTGAAPADVARVPTYAAEVRSSATMRCDVLIWDSCGWHPCPGAMGESYGTTAVATLRMLASELTARFCDGRSP